MSYYITGYMLTKSHVINLNLRKNEMNKKTDIMGEDTIYVVYTFAMTGFLYWLGTTLAFHG